MKLTIKDIAEVIIEQKQIHKDEDYFIFTVGYNPDTKYVAWQTGDNSYAGPIYHCKIWGVSTIHRRTNSREAAKVIINEIREQEVA